VYLVSQWLKRDKNVKYFDDDSWKLSDLFSVIKGTVRLILPRDQNKQLFNFLQEKPNFSGRGGDGGRRGIYLYCLVKDFNYTSLNNAHPPPPPP
jgi:hypothetical protein